VSDFDDLVVRVADDQDVPAIAMLRSLWSMTGTGDPGFEARMAAWLTHEGERRTTWLALRAERAVGMASLWEYHRMPRPDRGDSRWGYVSNMFVRDGLRGRGIGSALLAAVIAAADERGYARLVLSPSSASLAFYRRAGFIVPDDDAGEHRLLIRPRRAVG